MASNNQCTQLIRLTIKYASVMLKTHMIENQHRFSDPKFQNNYQHFFIPITSFRAPSCHKQTQLVKFMVMLLPRIFITAAASVNKRENQILTVYLNHVLL